VDTSCARQSRILAPGAIGVFIRTLSWESRSCGPMCSVLRPHSRPPALHDAVPWILHGGMFLRTYYTVRGLYRSSGRRLGGIWFRQIRSATASRSDSLDLHGDARRAESEVTSGSDRRMRAAFDGTHFASRVRSEGSPLDTSCVCCTPYRRAACRDERRYLGWLVCSVSYDTCRYKHNES